MLIDREMIFTLSASRKTLFTISSPLIALIPWLRIIDSFTTFFSHTPHRRAAANIEKLTREYVEVLKRLQVRLTRINNIEGALEAKAEIEAVQSVMPVITAEEHEAEKAVVSKPEPKPVIQQPMKTSLSSNLKSGLVLYFPFNSDDKNKVTDESVEKNHGIVN